MDPVLNYEFLAPQKIVFGWGRRREVGVLARRLGSRASCYRFARRNWETFSKRNRRRLALGRDRTRVGG